MWKLLVVMARLPIAFAGLAFFTLCIPLLTLLGILCVILMIAGIPFVTIMALLSNAPNDLKEYFTMFEEIPKSVKLVLEIYEGVLKWAFMVDDNT